MGDDNVGMVDGPRVAACPEEKLATGGAQAVSRGSPSGRKEGPNRIKNIAFSRKGEKTIPTVELQSDSHEQQELEGKLNPLLGHRSVTSWEGGHSYLRGRS